MNEIRVIYIAPGEDAREMMIENSLEAMQALVGGYIDTVKIGLDLVVVCNEEGRLNGMPYNCHVANVDFRGPIFLCCVEGDEFTDMALGIQMVKALGIIKRKAVN